MMGNIGNYTLTFILLAAGVLTGTASTWFGGMAAGEVSAMLDSLESPAKTMSGSVAVDVTDMLTKVYGIADPASTERECVTSVKRRIGMEPKSDEGRLWLDSSEGYRLEYAGAAPEVSAAALYDSGDTLAEYCYFFLFPYTAEDKATATRDQAVFTGAMLQEMADMGLDMGVNTLSPDLFEALGDYADSMVDVRLIDDYARAEGARYILMLVVQPGASVVDPAAAEATAALTPE